MSIYSDCRVYGPYKRDDGREHVIILSENGRKTVSYPKYKLELELDRNLEEHEVVHHKDGDPSNNSFDNLEILDRREHAKMHADRLNPQEFECPICGDAFTLEGYKLSKAISANKDKAGPFCGKSCAGKYGQKVQAGEIEPLGSRDVDKSYYSKH